MVRKKKSFKYFIGSSDNDDIRQLCIKLPQMIGFVKYFGSNKTMSFKSFKVRFCYQSK